MEIHTHNLQKAPGKKIWHYFFEFFMLFLAVFCGFIAENFREHRVEAERGKQYIRSFCEDLKIDTTNLNSQIEELTLKDIALSKIFDCYDTITQKAMSANCLRDIARNSRGFSDFIYTDRTIQQLKYAGGLRLIQNEEIVDSIIKYDATVRALQIHQEVLENQQQISVNAHNSMIGFIQLQHLDSADERGDLVLLTNNKNDIDKYFNEIFMFKRSCHRQLELLKDLKYMAKGLLIFLDKKQ